MPKGKLVIFAKSPVSGHVKTRLAARIGNRHALLTYQRLLQKTLLLCSGSTSEIHSAPDVRHPFFQRNKYHKRVRRQHNGNLGQRMNHAMRIGLAESDWVIIIGTDCPDMSANVLQNAGAALNAGSDCVIVPALDGGYVLIGLRQYDPGIFRGVQWSSRKVMKQTRRNIRNAGFTVLELPALRDLDNYQDYLQLRQKLAKRQSL